MTDWQTSRVKLQLRSVRKRKKALKKKTNRGTWVIENKRRWEKKGFKNWGCERTKKKKSNLYPIRGMWGTQGPCKLWKIKGDGFKLSNFHIKQTPGSMLLERLPHIQHIASEKGALPAPLLSFLILPLPLHLLHESTTAAASFFLNSFFCTGTLHFLNNPALLFP